MDDFFSLYISANRLQTSPLQRKADYAEAGSSGQIRALLQTYRKADPLES
jgi:hypothetical protein